MALELGVWDVKKMLAEMSPEQLLTWKAYYALEPFGQKRDDLRAGTISAIIANANRDPKKRSQPFKPEDFFPSLQDSSKRRSGARKPLMASEWQAARKNLVVNYGG